MLRSHVTICNVCSRCCWPWELSQCNVHCEPYSTSSCCPWTHSHVSFTFSPCFCLEFYSVSSWESSHGALNVYGVICKVDVLQCIGPLFCYNCISHWVIMKWCFKYLTYNIIVCWIYMYIFYHFKYFLGFRLHIVIFSHLK